MFLTRLILFQRLSIAMETHKRILETFTLLNWICDRRAPHDKAVIKHAGERFEGLDCDDEGVFLGCCGGGEEFEQDFQFVRLVAKRTERGGLTDVYDCHSEELNRRQEAIAIQKLFDLIRRSFNFIKMFG
jgi:hypothetical protein